MTTSGPDISGQDSDTSEHLLRRALDLVEHLEPNHYDEQHDVRKRGLDAVMLRKAARQEGLKRVRLASETSLFGHYPKTFVMHQNMPSSLPALERSLTNNKHLTKRVLASQGVPVARGRVVQDASAALEAFRNMTPPVVAKPISGSGGRGVTVGITTEEELTAATEDIVGRGSRILVEEMITSIDLRIMTVDGRAIATTLRIPANVVGDGHSTITELAEAKNAVRATNTYTRHSPIRITSFTEHHLELQGLTPESVPHADQRVFLHFTANISSGGDSYEVQEYVHPDLLRLAEQASACFPGARHAGIDILAKRLDAGLDEQKAIVCEVNLNNEVPLHIFPLYGQPNPVHTEVIRAYSNGTPARHRRLLNLRRPAKGRVKEPELTAIIRSAAPVPGSVDPLSNRSPERQDTSRLRAAFEAAGYPRTQFKGRLIFVEDGQEERVIHRSGRSVISRELAEDPGALYNLARELGIPTLERHRLAPDDLQEARQAIQQHPGSWRIEALPRRAAGTRRFQVRSLAALNRRWDQLPPDTTAVRLTQRPEGVGCELLLIGGRPVAALLVSPPVLAGDGKRSVQELIEDKVQARAAHPYLRHVPIKESLLTHGSLSRRNLEPDTVLPAGTIVPLARSPLTSQGPDTVSVSPDRFRALTRYAADLREGIGRCAVLSVQFVTRASQGKEDQEWALWRIDPDPTLARFAFPGSGESVDVYEAVVAEQRGGHQYQLPLDATALSFGSDTARHATA